MTTRMMILKLSNALTKARADSNKHTHVGTEPHETHE